MDIHRYRQIGDDAFSSSNAHNEARGSRLGTGGRDGAAQGYGTLSREQVRSQRSVNEKIRRNAHSRDGEICQRNLADVYQAGLGNDAAGFDDIDGEAGWVKLRPQ